MEQLQFIYPDFSPNVRQVVAIVTVYLTTAVLSLVHAYLIKAQLLINTIYIKSDMAKMK